MPEISSPDDQPEPDRLFAHADNSVDRARLYDLCATEMRRVAAQLIDAHAARSNAGDTMEPTALVNEAWLALFGGQPRSWTDRHDFVRSFTVAMRRILADRCKDKRWRKRCDPDNRFMAEVMRFAERADPSLTAFEAWLTELAADQPQLLRYIELRFFARPMREAP